MLLTDRRHRVLTLALAGMDVALFLPYATLLLVYWQSHLALPLLARVGAPTAALSAILAWPPPTLFAVLLTMMVLYLLAVDLLNQRRVAARARAGFLLLGIVGSSLVMVRLFVYRHDPVTDLRWLGQTINAVLNFSAGRRPETAVLLLNALLWLRASMNTDRDLSFFGVGFSFRLGLLLATVGGALLVNLGGRPPGHALTGFALFMAFGLSAVAVARIEEKALLVESSRGALLPWRHFSQVVATALATLALALAAATVYTPANLRVVLGWFAPLWWVVRGLLAILIYALAWLLTPLIARMLVWIRRLLDRIEPASVELPPANPAWDVAVRPADINALLERTPWLRYSVVILLLLLILGLIWFFFLRTTRLERPDEPEEVAAEQITFGGGLLGRGRRRLRTIFDLVRRYGIGSELLAAISIHNIYANVARVARRRGFPRHPSLPPDRYLPALFDAFPGCRTELEQITAAYMRVEYGDLALDEAELNALRAAYTRVRSSPSPEP